MARVRDDVVDVTIATIQLELRDQFAMAAIAGALNVSAGPEAVAERAYAIADAMLKERVK